LSLCTFCDFPFTQVFHISGIDLCSEDISLVSIQPSH
jgi:hypothetical protein